MPNSPPAPSNSNQPSRGPEERELYEALRALPQSQRLEALRNAPLSRTVKLSGASRIARTATEHGHLEVVLAEVRSYGRK